MQEIREDKELKQTNGYKINKYVLVDKFNHTISKPFTIIKNTEKEVVGQMLSDLHYNSVIPCYKDAELRFIEFDQNNNILFKF